MTRAFRLLPLGAVVACFLQTGCLLSYTRSQIVVARRGSDSRDLAKAEAVCQIVAHHYGLVARPFPQKYGRTTAYARPTKHDFTGPELYVNASNPDPKTLVTVTVIGESLTDAGRKQIAAEALEKLRHAFGDARVMFQENPYTEL
jgi:hypothetical protein